MKYGYARVSAQDQNLDRQINALESAGVGDRNIVSEKVSGKSFDRKHYKKLKKKLKEGDELYLLSLDRLGRCYEELCREWEAFKEKGIDVTVIDTPVLKPDTGDPLLDAFMKDLVLRVLAFASEHERKAIRQRQAEGIAAARKKGVKFGRPETVLPNEFYDIAEKVRNGNMSVSEGACKLGMTYSTFYYHYKKF